MFAGLTVSVMAVVSSVNERIILQGKLMCASVQ